MPTRSLRILIADHSHLQRLSIEKMLNHCGYHRVAPIGSFKELLLIVDNAHEPFDLLVINSTFGGTMMLDLEAFCRDCARVHHALIYDGLPLPVSSPQGKPPARVIKKLAGVPDTDAIKKVMVEIDPEKPKRSSYFFRTPSH
ncbi:response regulator [Pseudomonas sp. L13]|uniref:response regulator n=1 Tax=Pseudomonas sp. L13 TaxID=343985 RepID=UPI001379AE57|nr:response regulator [Pseudomonas sp. L13]NCE93594.1 response regulator [Pseudomonas sp. L13]